MGILDDAIREHLELKRKHGVPEDELQREEEEALGPARRDVAQQPEEAELAAGGTATAEAEHDEPADSEQENALFDMEAPHAEAEAPPAEHQDAAATPSDPPAADAPPADQPPAGMEPPALAEPTPVEPPPVQPRPAPEDPEPVLGDTEPHGFPAVDENEDEELHEAEDEGEPRHAEDEALAPDPDDEDLDVLEDTPDFLQETPEHDRLWFEQKPPRDFDFD